jgi:hypothetical protein
MAVLSTIDDNGSSRSLCAPALSKGTVSAARTVLADGRNNLAPSAAGPFLTSHRRRTSRDAPNCLAAEDGSFRNSKHCLRLAPLIAAGPFLWSANAAAAKDGFDEPRFYEGQVCGHVRRYSDTLLILLLKARRPGKYGDKVTAEHTGPGGGPITQITRVIVEPPSKSEDLSPC